MSHGAVALFILAPTPINFAREQRQLLVEPESFGVFRRQGIPLPTGCATRFKQASGEGEGRSSMENRSFCVILRGLTILDTRSAVADRAKNQNDRRSYEYGRPFLREYSDLCGADPLDA